MIETIVELISRKPSKPERPFMGELPSAVSELAFTRSGLLVRAEESIERSTGSIAEYVAAAPETTTVSAPEENITFDNDTVHEKNTAQVEAVVQKENKPQTVSYQMTKEADDQAALAEQARRMMDEHYSADPATKPVIPQD